MRYEVSQWEQVWVEYRFVVEADSPEDARQRVSDGEWEQCEMGDIDPVGEVDDSATRVEPLD